VVAAVILQPAEAPSPSLAPLWLCPWLDSSYTIYLTFYFGFTHPFKLSGSPCPSPSSLGQERGSHGLGEAAFLFSPRTTALVGEMGWVLLVVYFYFFFLIEFGIRKLWNLANGPCALSATPIIPGLVPCSP
jgi:hypothetical protein